MPHANEQSLLVLGDSEFSSCNEERSHSPPPTGRKLNSSTIFFSLYLLVAGLVGSFLTVVSYHNENKLSSGLGFSLVTRDLNREKRQQRFAEEEFKKHLAGPSMEAELFYHPTEKERDHPVMRSSGHLGKHQSDPSTPPPVGCQATVVLLRHCEKGTTREHCNAIGFERSKYIATLFGDDAESRWPAPSYLFALAPGQRKDKHVNNWREVETLQPLSDKTGVNIDESFGMDKRKDFSKHIFKMLRSGEMCGKVAVISWKHEDIPHLARSIGCGPDDGCPSEWANGNDFDSTWQILYSYHNQRYPSFAVEEKKNRHKIWGQHPEWWISGYVQMEGFDPLQFSKINGLYNN